MRRIAATFACFLSLSSLAQDEHGWAFETIAGNQIAWSCEGEGEPVVVLIAGGGLDAHASFGRTYHNYPGPGRICMYDRAGIGKSTFADPRTRRLVDLADELHTLATKRDWPAMILVGHSFGGFIARAYAAAHPERVAGILFLDSAQEDWLPALEAQMSESDWAIMARIVAWSTATFHEDYVEAQEAVRGMQFDRTLPITVVSRGIPHTTIRVEQMSYAGVDTFNREHDVRQARLADLSSDAQRRTAMVASHLIDNYDPWLVIEEIRKLVGRVRQKSHR